MIARVLKGSNTIKGSGHWYTDLTFPICKVDIPQQRIMGNVKRASDYHTEDGLAALDSVSRTLCHQSILIKGACSVKSRHVKVLVHQHMTKVEVWHFLL